MQATIAPPEERVLMDNISWETYERLLAESTDNPGTRFTYNDGILEIMVVYAGHEGPNRTLAQIVELVAVETRRKCWPTGSTTFKRKELEKGFEPDSSFYFRNAGAIRGKREIDLHTDPPPELVIEVDITRSSLKRFPIFAAIGVQEVWRYDGERAVFYSLEHGEYRPIEESIVLPPMTAAQATIFVRQSEELELYEWHDAVRTWVRARI